MQHALRVILPGYLFAMFILAFVWRLYVVWKQTGVNAFVLRGKKGLEGFIGILGILIALALLIVVLVYSFAPRVYHYFYEITWLQTKISAYIGLVLLGLSLLCMTISQAQMGGSWRVGIDNGKKTELIDVGLFKYSRNPIYVGARLMLWGIFLVLPNAVTLITACSGDILVHIQVRLEEKHLERLHGDRYRQYCKQVRRWI